MDKWIKTQTAFHSGLTVYEYKCPVCRYKVTVHHIAKLPETCYVCENRLEAPNETN